MKPTDSVLILGATGMLGHVLFRNLSMRAGLKVFAGVRSLAGLDRWFSPELLARVLDQFDANDLDALSRVLSEIRPAVVINCIGVIKQLDDARNPLIAIPVNSLFPHRLAAACRELGSRLIHISTDCVFSGRKGNYVESDLPDAEDLYGRTKVLGEVDYPHAVTLRTSIIGHELKGHLSLIDWFLAQNGTVRGFTRAIYTGFPTVEMARIIADYVINNPELHGVYHVSSGSISKYDLLCLVREVYGKTIEIEPYDGLICDRSLDSTRFREATGYVPPTWPDLVAGMHADWSGIVQRYNL